jgi:hypothetical protein
LNISTSSILPSNSRFNVLSKSSPMWTSAGEMAMVPFAGAEATWLPLM